MKPATINFGAPIAALPNKDFKSILRDRAKDEKPDDLYLYNLEFNGYASGGGKLWKAVGDEIPKSVFQIWSINPNDFIIGSECADLDPKQEKACNPEYKHGGTGSLGIHRIFHSKKYLPNQENTLTITTPYGTAIFSSGCRDDGCKVHRIGPDDFHIMMSISGNYYDNIKPEQSLLGKSRIFEPLFPFIEYMHTYLYLYVYINIYIYDRLEVLVHTCYRLHVLHVIQ